MTDSDRNRYALASDVDQLRSDIREDVKELRSDIATVRRESAGRSQWLLTTAVGVAAIASPFIVAIWERGK